MIKTAIITERVDIAFGGVERSVLVLASELQRFGSDVKILTAKSKTTTDNVVVLCGNKPGSRTSRRTYEKALREHLAENHYDIVHSTLPFEFADIYQPRGGSYAEAMIRNAASYQNRIKYLCKLATHRTNIKRTQLLNAERLLCMSDNKTIVAALSGYVKGHFRKHYNMPDNRIAVIPNGVKPVSPANAEAVTKRRAQVMAMWNVTETDKPLVLAFAANNFRLKGLGSLIKAMGIAKDRTCERRICLIVAGRDDPGKYRKLAAELGVLREIAFIGEVSDIRQVLSISDIAVLPTYYDPSSRFILEALACKKPVITTRFNGAIEMFRDKRHGFVIDSPDNVHALAEAIAYYSRDENAGKASDAIAADNLLENISIARHARQLLELYNSILNERGKKCT